MKQNKYGCGSEANRLLRKSDLLLKKKLQKELQRLEESEKLALWLYLSALLKQLTDPARRAKTPVERKVDEILKGVLSRPIRITH